MEPLDHWQGFRSLDRALGTAKGSAFRAFKRVAGHWRESVDFRLLDPDTDRDLIAALRAAGSIYVTSAKAVILSPAMAAAVEARMRSRITQPAE